MKRLRVLLAGEAVLRLFWCYEQTARFQHFTAICGFHIVSIAAGVGKRTRLGLFICRLVLRRCMIRDLAMKLIARDRAHFIYVNAFWNLVVRTQVLFVVEQDYPDGNDIKGHG